MAQADRPAPRAPIPVAPIRRAADGPERPWLASRAEGRATVVSAAGGAGGSTMTGRVGSVTTAVVGGAGAAVVGVGLGTGFGFGLAVVVVGAAVVVVVGSGAGAGGA